MGSSIIDSIPKWALAVGAAALLFAVLAASRWLLSPGERGAVGVQESYNALAAAMENEKLLPLQDEDTLLMAIANLVITSGQLSEPRPSGAGGTEIKLGEVLSAVAVDGQVRELRLNPQRWREIQSGQLRMTLQALAKLPLRKQAGTVHGSRQLPVQATRFDFAVTVGMETYVFTPYFEGQQCNQILIKRQ